jgi:hypothetical protein
MTSTARRIKKIFSHMKSRCYDPNDKRYDDWGGRGIRVCEEWLKNPEEFVRWSLENGYQDDFVIDRINNSGDYAPSNCRWVTIAENNQNRRSSRNFTYNNKTQNLQQWCDEFNVSRSMVNKRLEMGWDFEKALFTPKKVRDKESLIGKAFGKLVVLDFVGKDKFRQSLYNCKCSCGNTVLVNGNKLKSGHTTSCGCYRRERAKENLPR